MRKKTIYMHIGTPKTGTTSIQEYLVRQSSKLLMDGYLVPKSSRTHYNHLFLVNYAVDADRQAQFRVHCKTQTRTEVLDFRDRFFHDLREEIDRFQGDCVILSNEHCYTWLRSKEEVARLKHLLEGLADQVKIVVYIREQSDMLCSQYSTWLKNNHKDLIMDIEAFGRLPMFDYNESLKLWEDVFGIENVILKIFDRKKLVEGDIISDFCQAVGLPKYKDQAVSLNFSLNAKQAEFLRVVNSHMGELTSKKEIEVQHRLNQMVANTQIASPPISALIDKAYQRVYVERNEDLAKRYAYDDQALFSMKELKVQALDQRILLTDADKCMIARQIIERNEDKILCKCLAAIFELPYKGQKVSMEYVHAFDAKDYEKKRRGLLYYYALSTYRWIRRVIRGR